MQRQIFGILFSGHPSILQGTFRIVQSDIDNGAKRIRVTIVGRQRDFPSRILQLPHSQQESGPPNVVPGITLGFGNLVELFE